MSPQQQQRRRDAIRVADAINLIEGVPVSAYAYRLSEQWARNEITGAEMKRLLIATHKRPSPGEKR